jgi:hypothetical protein
MLYQNHGSYGFCGNLIGVLLMDVVQNRSFFKNNVTLSKHSLCVILNIESQTDKPLSF